MFEGELSRGGGNLSVFRTVHSPAADACSQAVIQAQFLCPLALLTAEGIKQCYDQQHSPGGCTVCPHSTATGEGHIALPHNIFFSYLTEVLSGSPFPAPKKEFPWMKESGFCTSSCLDVVLGYRPAAKRCSPNATH